MAPIERLRVAWTGFPGAPGVSTFYFIDAALQQAALRTFFDAIKNNVPADVTFQVDTNGDVIEDTTGALTASWVGAATLPVHATGSTAYMAPAGWMVKWLTSTVAGGSRISGRTFIVPGSEEIMGNGGGLNGVVVATMNAAAAALVSSSPGNMITWRRPRMAQPSWTDVHGKTHPAISRQDGVGAVVINSIVPNEAVVLRSRRD